MGHEIGGLFEALGQVGAEVERARAKFPENRHLLGALVEEAGELARELLEGGPSARVRAEAMQVACVAVRIMTEGDADYAHVAADRAAARARPPEVSAETKAALATAAAQREGGRRGVGKASREGAKAAKAAAGGKDAREGEKAGDGAEPRAPTCCDCGQAYERTGNAQKRCAECGRKRQAERQAAWEARKRGGAQERQESSAHNLAADADRLARIKAVNERMDRIPG